MITRLINNKLKRFIIICLILVSTVFPGWSVTNKPTTINILMPAPFAESTTNLIERFNIEQKGKYQIKVTKGPLETEAVSDLAISSLLLGQTTYDILLIDVTWLPKYAAAKWIEPLDHLIDVDDWNALASGAKLGNSFKGNIYRWPLTSDMGLLYWRKDLMDKPPNTPTELLTIAKELKDDNKVDYGYVWQGRQYEGLSCVFLEVLKGFGGQWLDDTGNAYLTNKESLNAAKWLKALITSGASPKSVTNFAENEALQTFKSGEAALMRNWPYAWSELQKESSKVRGKVGVTTMISKENNEPVSTLGSWGFSILRNSRHKSAAYKAIKYLTSDIAQKELFLENGYTPTKEAIFKDKELLSISPILPELEKALSITKPRPQTPLYAQISDVLQNQLSAILTDQKSVNEAMKLAQSKTQRILSSAGKL